MGMTGEEAYAILKRQIQSGGGTTNYNDLTNKPTFNGVTIEGDPTSQDYGIE